MYWIYSCFHNISVWIFAYVLFFNNLLYIFLHVLEEANNWSIDFILKIPTVARASMLVKLYDLIQKHYQYYVFYKYKPHFAFCTRTYAREGDGYWVGGVSHVKAPSFSVKTAFLAVADSPSHPKRPCRSTDDWATDGQQLQFLKNLQLQLVRSRTTCKLPKKFLDFISHRSCIYPWSLSES
jgi:hypothetical protein